MTVKNCPSYQILIPAYNAGKTLSVLLDELMSMIPAPLGITVVDDGSSDETAMLCRSYPVEIFRNPVNQGKGSALKTGFEAFLTSAQADYLLCMDADLQHPAASISDFLEKAEQTADRFIIGSRKRTAQQMPVHRILSNLLTSRLLSMLTKQKIEDSQCGFRLIHRDVLQKISLLENGFQLESEMLLKAARAGVRISFVPIPTIYAKEKSSMRNLQDTLRFIRLIVRYLVRKNEGIS